MNDIELERKKVYDALLAKGNAALDSLKEIAPIGVDYEYDLLMSLINENKDTVFGHANDFASIRSYEDFRRLPLTDYNDYRALADRIADEGESNVLTSRPVVHLYPTTGTTGKPKIIPAVQESLDLSNSYTLPAALAAVDRYFKAQGKPGIPNKPGMTLIEIGDPQHSDAGLPISGISGTSVRNNKQLLAIMNTSPLELISPSGYLDSKYLHALFALREPELGWIASCYMTTTAAVLCCIRDHWQQLCDDIERGSISPDIEVPDDARAALDAYLEPMPERAAFLRSEFAKGFNTPIAPRIWPDFAFIISIGTGEFKVHTDIVREFVGQQLPIHNLVISSSESLIALALDCNDDSFVLISQAAFFEFLPEDSEDPDDIVPIDKLELGKRYELIVSSISGLCRYRLSDIVEISGFYGQLPRLRFSHRKNLVLNLAGEKTTSADMLKVMDRFSQASGVKVAEYCVYANAEEAPGHYDILIEPEGSIDLGKVPEYQQLMEDELCKLFGYRYEREASNIGPVRLFVSQHQTHQLYREMLAMRGKNINQLKPVRVLNKPELRGFFFGMVEGA